MRTSLSVALAFAVSGCGSMGGDDTCMAVGGGPCVLPDASTADATLDGGRDAGASEAALPDDAGETGADAATDAPADAPGGAGAVCKTDTDCRAGLRCCYPCGVPDCLSDLCLDTGDGGCPAFP